MSYIEIYRPKLIPFLAPADSPMLHAIKMIREYYTEFARHGVAVISPCIAKKREFEATGLGDCNVTMLALDEYSGTHGVDLARCPAVDYDNPPAERAHEVVGRPPEARAPTPSTGIIVQAYTGNRTYGAMIPTLVTPDAPPHRPRPRHRHHRQTLVRQDL